MAPRAPLNEDERLKFLTARLKQRFDARRIAGTSLIEVRAMAPDPNMAAAIANAFTTAYLEDQAEANTEVARSATAWVRESVKNAGTVSRVLSNAIPPLAPDGPRPIVLLAGALAAGMLAGGAGAVIKKRLYGRVRGSADAAQLAGAECFGALPLQRKALRRTQLCDRSDPESRRLGTFGDAYAWGMTPHSIFSDTICRASVALTLEHPRIATLGVTSCFKGEGKTTVAVNLARVTAAAGYKVLLVDAASDAELTRQLTKRSGLPFDQVLDGAVALADACWTDTQTNLQFVGAEANGRWLQSKQTAQQIAQLAQHYDLVIFDLPSVAYEAHSVRAAAAALDGLLLVVEYARARPEECERCLTYAAPAAERFCGVVLSKVDRRGLKHFARRGEPHAR